MLYENLDGMSEYMPLMTDTQAQTSLGIHFASNNFDDEIKLNSSLIGTTFTKFDDPSTVNDHMLWGSDPPTPLCDLSSITDSTQNSSSSRDGSLKRAAKNLQSNHSLLGAKLLDCCLLNTSFEAHRHSTGAESNPLINLPWLEGHNEENIICNEPILNSHQRKMLLINGIALPTVQQQKHNRCSWQTANSNKCALGELQPSCSPHAFNTCKSIRVIESNTCEKLYNNTNPIVIRPWLQFGGFGTTNSNFTEPNSVVLSKRQGQIVVADTNSHHIKLFDSDGRFLYKFGEAGKSHGKMLYPCKIDLLPGTGDRLAIVQRNPMPQIQIFKLNGQYENRFAHSMLKFPRAMCVDEMGLIIVIESKIMTCHIFSPDGRYLRKLNLQNDLNFPFDICAHNGEIFISDNQAHCVKVFDYNGCLTRKVGEGIVKFPVCLDFCSHKNSIFVTDNHERLNVNQFSLQGELINSYYSGIKHAQCYDVTTSADDMILASKDYRIYRYKLPDTTKVEIQNQ